MNKQTIIPLTPPLLSFDHIKEKTPCIRAHRERLFRIEYQYVNGKHLFHNYGHGGAGWTFLFGAVNTSLEQFDQCMAQNHSLKKSPIAVIGAGCYGLLTAISLAQRGLNVGIIAKHTQDIPSYKAAGFFFPRARKSSTPQERAVFHATGMHSYTQYLSIAQGTHPFITAGAQILPAYYGLDIDPEFAPYIQKGLMAAPQRVTVDFNNGKRFEAMQYMVPFMNTTMLMTELEELRKKLGIPIIQRDIADFEELNESIIFNCAGLGAKELAHDARIIPVQGHLITLKNQPPLPYMINAKVIQKNPAGNPRDELIYFAPKDEGILGITFIRGQADASANAHEFERLLERCRNFFGT